MDRGKRRSPAQRIGTKGERLFAAWAVDHHLSPNKADEDLGVDFFCQVLQSTESGESEPVSGAVLAVHVRATDGKSRPRILLTRHDAFDLLQHSGPAVLIGIHITSGQVGALFLDESLIERLQGFLGSTNQSHSIRLDEMGLDPVIFDKS